MRPIPRFSRSAALVASLAALLIAAAPGAARRARGTDLPAQLLPIFGGTGGSTFTLSCGAGRVLSGLQYRNGLELDAVGVLCRPLNADGTLGSETTVGGLMGGGGGTARIQHCGPGAVVSGGAVSYGLYVDGLALYCRTWNAATRSFGSGLTTWTLGRYASLGANVTEEKCEAPTQPAHAIRGRAHSLVDAFAFTCDEP